MKQIIFSIVWVCFFGAGNAMAAQITMDDLDDLPRADLYFLGETHDNPVHHSGQARVIKAVHPKAVVFEMLNPEQAAKITPELLADENALEKALGWNASGWPDFSMYYPIFSSLQGVKIYGAALPKGDVRRAFKDGAAAVFRGDSAVFGLDRPIDPAVLEQRKIEQFNAHCKAMPLEMMDGMVQAQRLRDAQLAATMAQAFNEAGGGNQAGPVVLIAGAGHTHYDWATPYLLSNHPARFSMVSIAFIEGKDKPEKTYDFWIGTKPAPRENPCLAFN